MLFSIFCPVIVFYFWKSLNIFSSYAENNHCWKFSMHFCCLVFYLMHKDWSVDDADILLIPSVFNSLLSTWNSTCVIRPLKPFCQLTRWLLNVFLRVNKNRCQTVYPRDKKQFISWINCLTSFSIVLLICFPDLDFYDIIIKPTHSKSLLYYVFFSKIFWNITIKYIWLKNIDIIKFEDDYKWLSGLKVYSSLKTRQETLLISSHCWNWICALYKKVLCSKLEKVVGIKLDNVYESALLIPL